MSVSASARAQLEFLEEEVRETREMMESARGVRGPRLAARLHMLLSIAESVKQARYHDLNCRNLEKKR